MSSSKEDFLKKIAKAPVPLQTNTRNMKNILQHNKAKT